MNCRNGSITRKTILNRKNQEQDTVQILKTLFLTVILYMLCSIDKTALSAYGELNEIGQKYRRGGLQL